MYRILRPNGMWITATLGNELDSVDGAVRYANQFAKSVNEYGEFLIYKGYDMQPVAATRLIPLTEEDDAHRT